jgi:hypothetical protein
MQALPFNPPYWRSGVTYDLSYVSKGLILSKAAWITAANTEVLASTLGSEQVGISWNMQECGAYRLAGEGFGGFSLVSRSGGEDYSSTRGR